MSWRNRLHQLTAGVPWRRRSEMSVPVRHRAELEESIDAAAVATPATSIYESADEILILADVPGASADTTRLTVADGVLRITARSRALLLPAQGDLDGPGAGTWLRQFQLPEAADGAGARSTLRDGVLTVRLPKRRSAARTIPVRAS